MNAVTAMNETTPETSSSGTAGPLDITHFDFQHPVFRTPGARFLLKGNDKTPTFRIDMGDLEALIDVDILCREFNIVPESHDGKLVALAVAGLRYVPDIKPQDSIPSELLTGRASWSVSAKHKQIAEQRLQVQLLSWVSGKEVLITDPNEIGNFLGMIENREKLRKAFNDAADAIGYPGQPDQVVQQLEILARELCYIEALRDRFALIPRISARIVELSKSYGGDRNAKMELNRVQTLLNTGVKEYTAMFAEADAQTGEIISALKSIDRQVEYIRRIRDDLHFLLMQWEPQIKNLPQWRNHRSNETEKALSELYRFLAPRYSSGQSLLKKRQDAKARSEGDHGQGGKAQQAKNTRSATRTQ